MPCSERTAKRVEGEKSERAKEAAGRGEDGGKREQGATAKAALRIPLPVPFGAETRERLNEEESVSDSDGRPRRVGRRCPSRRGIRDEGGASHRSRACTNGHGTLGTLYHTARRSISRHILGGKEFNMVHVILRPCTTVYS